MVFKQPTFFGEPYEPQTGADQDAALEEAVANALAVAGGIDAADVKVTLDDHAVVLTGIVATAPEIERATAVAQAIAGTTPVRNEIKIAQ
ncbi:putative periplasmic or secreted lipoprotein [Rhizobium sp. CF122]|uniref:BON domain-containing protein n=1 Tax=Rhizobium sp. CF122 TaxID=1144312 RepID=UPI00027163F0|nr:BON domain-containing protein [Rhizobium sp. CF122]EJL57609.1 putative periplasmic or secreted lipoprotein [Rhizobium sp. CF122]